MAVVVSTIPLSRAVQGLASTSYLPRVDSKHCIDAALSMDTDRVKEGVERAGFDDAVDNLIKVRSTRLTSDAADQSCYTKLQIRIMVRRVVLFLHNAQCYV